MIVWVLWHDDEMYDMGDKYVRGVYATREGATAALRTKAPDYHEPSCCEIQAYDVEIEGSSVSSTAPFDGYVTIQ